MERFTRALPFEFNSEPAAFPTRGKTSMANPRKQEVENENRYLREALEEVYDRLAEMLGLDEGDEEDE